MLRIRRSTNDRVVFALSGRMAEDDLAELQTLIRCEASHGQVVLDLKDLTLVSGEAINFLVRCESDGITLENCPAYVREWMTRQRG
jgi:hypothetical protein